MGSGVSDSMVLMASMFAYTCVQGWERKWVRIRSGGEWVVFLSVSGRGLLVSAVVL